VISTKIKRTKSVRIINANAVRGRLSENYFTRKFIARNIFDILSLTSTTGRTSRIFLGYVIPWINKASLALSMAHISQHHRAACYYRLIWGWQLYSAIEFFSVIDQSIETYHYWGRESVLESISAIEAPAVLCTHYIDDLLPDALLPLCSYWGYGQDFHYYITSSNLLFCGYEVIMV
jgi:hypothetical protein